MALKIRNFLIFLVIIIVIGLGISAFSAIGTLIKDREIKTQNAIDEITLALTPEASPVESDSAFIALPSETTAVEETFFLVEDCYWASAELIESFGETGFNVPVGTRIYAPYDGTIGKDEEGMEDCDVISISKMSVWSEEEAYEKEYARIGLMALHIELAPGLEHGSQIKKGQFIGTVESIDPVQGNFNLVIQPEFNDEPEMFLENNVRKSFENYVG